MPSHARRTRATGAQTRPARGRNQDAAGDSKTMPDPRGCSRQSGTADAGPFAADIASFRLHLAAEGKSARTISGYTGATRWFAASWLLGQTSHAS